MGVKLKELLFSVVIPLYNKEKYIQNTLKSVLNQEYQNFEIIIVNDGSTDNSLHQIQEIEDSRIHLFNQQNLGVSEARNRGVKESKGNYITLLDADDYWYPNHLTNFITSINKNTGQKVFCNNYKIQISEQNFKIPEYSYLPSKSEICVINDYFESSFINSIAWTSAICFSKSIFNSNAYWFDSKMSSGQDTDLWIRLGLNYSFVFNPKITAIHKKFVADNLSKSNNADSRFLMTQKYLEEETGNANLKRFMDNNRFSILLKYIILNNNKPNQEILRSQINLTSLNKKQYFLLTMPSLLLRVLLVVKRSLVYFNINILIFR